MEEKSFEVTMKDIKKYEVLKDVLENRIKGYQAAQLLGYTKVHISRLKKRLQKNGFKGLLRPKKPSVDLKHQVSPAYQLRRYAYTAKLPLSILTDFEEFSVYDARIKPTPKDSASCARIFYCEYKDYLKNFDFIYDTFSKDGILKGSFDRYIESNKNKRGTSEVDKEFLKLIDKW